MYTAVAAGILLFPWTILGISVLGWLGHRKRRNSHLSAASSPTIEVKSLAPWTRRQRD